MALNSAAADFLPPDDTLVVDAERVVPLDLDLLYGAVADVFEFPCCLSFFELDDLLCCEDFGLSSCGLEDDGCDFLGLDLLRLRLR